MIIEGSSYQKLIVWQKAMELVEAVYRVTGKFPKEEMFGLTAQVRRASVSIPSNIAEGHGRKTRRDFKRFLSIANGSLRETETQILIGSRLGYLSQEELGTLRLRIDEVGRLIAGLIRSLLRQED